MSKEDFTNASSTTLRNRRDTILDEATRLFAERGYDGASMADLAERVGLRKASLFHHFASKDVLYTAVLDRLLTQVHQAIADTAVTGKTYSESLDKMSDAVTTVLGNNKYAAALLVREAIDWGPFVQQQGPAMLAAAQAAESFIKAGQKAGEFIEGDSKQLMLSLLSVHMLPFATPKFVEEFAGSLPTDSKFLAKRLGAVREHIRRLLVKS